MPCYDPEPPYSYEIKESSLKASRILCKLVSSNLSAGVEVPLDILQWYLEHRKIDLKIQEETLRAMLRGGSWDSHPRFCRSASRCDNLPDYRLSRRGFRVCCPPSGESDSALRQPLTQHPFFSLAAEIDSLQRLVSAKNQQNES